jgi:hypothetical protein
VPGHSDAGASLLADLASAGCGHAASLLSRLDGYLADGAAQLARLAVSPALTGYQRLEAANALAMHDVYQGEAARLLARVAADTTLQGDERITAAKYLFSVALAPIAAAQGLPSAALARLAEDPTLDARHRIWAARELAARVAFGGTRPSHRRHHDRRAYPGRCSRGSGRCGLSQGVQLLKSLACSSALNGYRRIDAARALAGHSAEGANLLAAFAQDADFDSEQQTRAALFLTHVDPSRGARLLARLAKDTALPSHTRSEAAQMLAESDIPMSVDAALDYRAAASKALTTVDGCRELGASLLAQLANEADPGTSAVQSPPVSSPQWTATRT